MNVSLTRHNLTFPSVAGIPRRELWSLPLNDEARNKIKDALTDEPFLTINQVANLFYSVRRDGQPAKPSRFRLRGKELELTPGYNSAKDLLGRMVRDKELIVFKPKNDQPQSTPNLYALPGTKKPINDNALYGHEMDCADCFVALRRTYGEKLVRWQRHWNEVEREVFGEKYGIWPDRVFELEHSDEVYFLEVDRGTEDLRKQIQPKIEDYFKLWQAYKDKQSFTIIFTAQGYRYHEDDNARRDELNGFIGRLTSCPFIVATQSEFTKNPNAILGL